MAACLMISYSVLARCKTSPMRVLKSSILQLSYCFGGGTAPAHWAHQQCRFWVQAAVTDLMLEQPNFPLCHLYNTCAPTKWLTVRFRLTSPSIFSSALWSYHSKILFPNQILPSWWNFSKKTQEKLLFAQTGFLLNMLHSWALPR